MRIVNRKQFLEMPAGTLYSKYQPCIFHELMIKEDSLENDFIHQQIATALENTGSNDLMNKAAMLEAIDIDLPMDFDCCGRDGCFDEDQLFAVWSDDDRIALIERLQECGSNE